MPLFEITDVKVEAILCLMLYGVSVHVHTAHLGEFKVKAKRNKKEDMKQMMMMKMMVMSPS